ARGGSERATAPLWPPAASSHVISTAVDMKTDVPPAGTEHTSVQPRLVGAPGTSRGRKRGQPDGRVPLTVKPGAPRKPIMAVEIAPRRDTNFRAFGALRPARARSRTVRRDPHLRAREPA